jgi:hypothetical protein
MIAPNPERQPKLLPAPLTGVKVMEFFAGMRTLNTTEQGQFTAESPCVWALYFADYGTLCRLSAEKVLA